MRFYHPATPLLSQTLFDDLELMSCVRQLLHQLLQVHLFLIQGLSFLL